jgi:CheY-like chemotaxis protein
VLVADDEPGVRGLLRRVLMRDFDAEVIEAADGVAALGCLLAGPVDLLVLDLTMPVMGGLETLQAIRESPEHGALPVVMMTGRAAEPDFQRARDLGISGFIVKPFPLADFRERIAPILDAIRETIGPRGPVAIDAAHRVLLVDCHPEFLQVAERVLSRLCRVETAGHEFAAIKLCLEVVPDAVLVGETSGLSSRETVAHKLRGMHGRRTPQLIAAAPSAEMSRLESSGLFDAVVVRSLDADRFETDLAARLDEPSRARLLLHPASSWLVEALNATAGLIGGALGEDLTVTPHRLAPEPAVRWLVSDVELLGPRAGWTVRIRCPFEAAVQMTRTAASADPDDVSDGEAIAAMSRIAAGIGHLWRDRASLQGLRCHANAPHTALVAGAGAGADADGPLQARRWLAAGRHTVAIVETLPGAARSRAEGTHG